MDLQTTLQLQAALLLFLGAVVLLAHQTSRAPGANAGARWFFASCVCGGAGLALQAQRGRLSPALTVVAGNLLFLLLVVFLTRSVELMVEARARCMPYLLAGAVTTAAILAFYTFAHPDVSRRVLIASISLPLMLSPATVLLLRSRSQATRAATRTLAGLLMFFSLGCGLRAVSILRGAKLASGANWTGAILIAGVALCFLWMDMLRLRSQLEQQAMTDPLTGLFNRRGMEMLAEREIARASRQRTSVSLLTVDIDHFKSINDQYGHMIGDSALVGIADVLRRCVRRQDIAVRTGGDEFVVLLTESSTQAASETIRRIKAQVNNLGLKTHDGRPFPVSVSIGTYTTKAGSLETYADLVHASDMDLYLLKGARPAVIGTAAARLAEVPVAAGSRPAVRL